MFTSFLQRNFTSRTIANDRSITLLKLLHACPEGDEERAQASNQVTKSPVPRQTCQHPFLLRLALPFSKTFTHQVFLKGDVWNHACFLVPFCQTPSSRRLSSRKTSRSRTASVICYVRVYCSGQADTSAKQRIVVPISRVTGNGSRLVPCLGNARAVSRFPLQGAASKIRCSTDAPSGLKR